MARRTRGHAAASHVNNDRWLLTYADMITLLLALFIILFSISSISKVKFNALAHDIAGSFNGTETLAGQAADKKAAQDQESLEALAAALHHYVRQRQLGSKIDVHIEQRGVVISLRTDSALFKSGSAVLAPQAGQIIHAVAGFLLAPAQRQRILKVEGNTDDVPISTPQYPTNWELSTSRAVAVTRHLSEFDGIAPNRLSAIGFAEWHPLAPNTSNANRLLNRRVDIVVLRLNEH